MRVADVDELYEEMKDEFDEMAIGDEFKAGFMYAMGIVRRKRGIKIPKAVADDGRIHVTTLELRGDGN